MSKRILITDDALYMRTTLRHILVKNGFEVVGEAESGEEAIRMFMDLKPDLVTMDLAMPEMDGIHALREIRKVDKNAKVVMCTSMGQSAMVVEAIDAGASDFLVKPFRPELVVRALKSQLVA